MAARRFVHGVLALAAALHCGKSTPPSTSATSASASAARSVAAIGADDAGDPMDPRETEQWAQAEGGEAEELARLADLVGCAGLRERASQPALRSTAVRAMRYCRDFSELPFLAHVASEGGDAEAHDALDAVVDLAAMPRRATDPEDADELHSGCGALLALARATDRPKERRVPAIRALRMLVDRGCVTRADIPTDLDAK